MDARAYTFETGRRATEELLKLLEEYGLSPSPGSSLERMTLSVYDILYSKDPEYERESVDIREAFTDLAAASELAVQILAVRDHADFPKLIPHLRLLDEGEASLATKASQTDQASNKITELLAACLSMRCGQDIELDDPVRSSGGRNPDVLVTMDGVRWGIACKTLHSLHPESIIDNVNLGLGQIDDSPAETGFLFFNLKNVIDRDRYWAISNETEWKAGGSPRFFAFSSFEEPMALFMEETNRVARIMVNHIGNEEVHRLFKGTRALHGVLFYAHVLCGVLLDGMPVATSIRFPTWASLQAEDDPPEPSPILCFHRVMQDIPRG